MHPTIRKIISSNFVNYSLKVLIGFFIGYFLFKTFPNYNLFWSLLSIILVISPEEVDSKKLTVERVKANFIGSLAGIATWFLPIPDLAKIVMAIILALVTCRVFDVVKVARTAIVAVLIVLIEHKNDDFLAPISRFFSVAGGCLIGLLVSVVVGNVRNYLLGETNNKEN